MYKILHKKTLNPTVIRMDIEAPLVARKAKAGQFIILRVDSEGERIPLTIADVNIEERTVAIIFQIVGSTTALLAEKNEGDTIEDFVGPLGMPTHTEGVRSVCIVGGGVGCAIALPVAKAFLAQGATVTSIIGFRTKDLVILEDEFKKYSHHLTLMTDDGSYQRQGNVTLPLREMLENGAQFDLIVAIGPLVMMKYVTETARPFGVPVTVSMNPVMIDGTGMCGGCRLTLHKDGQSYTKFACVDGPDFNGYEVDFDEAMSRARMYADFERHTYEATCNLLRKAGEQNG